MNSLPEVIRNAISSNDVESIQAWLEMHPPPSYKILQESLLSAMRNGSLEMIDILLNHGATVSLLTMSEAFTRAETAVFQQLIDHGWDIDSTEFQVPPVQWALRNERLLRWFLDHGANPNTKSVRRGGSCLQPCTPLAAAAKLSDPTMLRILLSHGAEMDPLALFHAIGVRGQKNGLATTVMLVEHGADVNHVAENWGTPLAYAVHRNAKEKLLFLLKHGADPTIPSRRNRITAIGSAASSGRLELYQILKAAVDGQI